MGDLEGRSIFYCESSVSQANRGESVRNQMASSGRQEKMPTIGSTRFSTRTESWSLPNPFARLLAQVVNDNLSITLLV